MRLRDERPANRRVNFRLNGRRERRPKQVSNPGYSTLTFNVHNKDQTRDFFLYIHNGNGRMGEVTDPTSTLPSLTPLMKPGSPSSGHYSYRLDETIGT